MANTPFRITPNLGPDLFQVVKAGKPWYEGLPVGSPQLGVVVHGSDGREYIRVKASGAIPVAAAPGTEVAVTVNGYDDATAAAGAGGYYAPNSDMYSGAIEEGDIFWAAKADTAAAPGD